MIELWVGVLVASVLGSVHCVGMCGPIASLASARSPAGRVHLPVVAPRRSAVGTVVAYNGGRLLAYVGLGAGAGAVGFALDLSGAALGVSQLATVVAGVTMLLLGAVGLWRCVGTRLGMGDPPKVRMLGRLLGAVMGLRPSRRAAALGALTGAMPCGWLWAFAVTAAGTGGPVQGAAVMLVFWAGTVPAMAALGVGAHAISGRLGSYLPWVMPILLIVMGATTLAFRPRVEMPSATANSAETPDGAHLQSVISRGAPCH